jgi:hypothetical protein
MEGGAREAEGELLCFSGEEETKNVVGHQLKYKLNTK